MTKITIDVPEELERRAKMLKVELSLLAIKALKDRVEKLEEAKERDKIERFRQSVARSKLTEKDVDEISDKINTAMWEHHKKKYNL